RTTSRDRSRAARAGRARTHARRPRSHRDGRTALDPPRAGACLRSTTGTRYRTKCRRGAFAWQKAYDLMRGPARMKCGARLRSPAMASPLRTSLCDLLGLEHAIIQSGMRGIAGPELVAEVCRAGALGILAGLDVPPDELRRQIARIRELTDRPF